VGANARAHALPHTGADGTASAGRPNSYRSAGGDGNAAHCPAYADPGRRADAVADYRPTQDHDHGVVRQRRAGLPLWRIAGVVEFRSGNACASADTSPMKEGSPDMTTAAARSRDAHGVAGSNPSSTGTAHGGHKTLSGGFLFATEVKT
jgi:hypothetical protein